jgi:predicted Zn-dependent protease
LKNYNQAVSFLRQYLINANEDALGYYYLGQTLKALKETKAAKSLLAQAAALNRRQGQSGLIKEDLKVKFF